FRWALGAAALLMVAISTCNTLFPLLLGQLVDEIKAGVDRSLVPEEMYSIVAYFVVLISGLFLVREVLQILRSYLVENTCTRLEKTMTVQAVARLMKADLAALRHAKVGALHGRLTRSVVGFVRFVRLAFLDFLPPLVTGLFALVAAFGKQP